MGFFEFAKIHGGLQRETVAEAEIIDVIPTIAELLGIPYDCQGKSILW